MGKSLNQAKANAIRYTKKKVEHWQVVSLALAGYDAISIVIAFFLALWFRFDCRYSMIPKEFLGAYLKFIGIYVIFSLFVFWRLRLYNSIWRFASYSELVRMIVATGISSLFHCTGMTLFLGRMPLSYYFFGTVIQFGMTLMVRFAYRFVLLERSKRRKTEEIAKAKRVLLIGGGKAGQIILRDIKTAKELKDIVCCIIDDNPNKWGRYIEGVPIVGGRDDILSCVERYKIDKIIVAVPSATAEEKRDILNICKETGCELKNLPGVYQFLTGAVSLVLQAGTYAHGGEIFVLDMGSPVKIDTLARNLIKLSGLKPDVDIKVEYTGLRPGEKLYEEKLMAEEGLKKTRNELIHIGCPIPFEVETFLKELETLMGMAYINADNIREKVAEVVTTYHPAGEHGSEKKGEVYERLLGEESA